MGVSENGFMADGSVREWGHGRWECQTTDLLRPDDNDAQMNERDRRNEKETTKEMDTDETAPEMDEANSSNDPPCDCKDRPSC